MIGTLNTTALIILFIFVLFCTNTAFAAEQNPDFRFNNTNWFTTLHPVVSTFTVDVDGSANGTTTSNTPFSLRNIPNEVGLRIQKFIIQDHFHYIIAGNVVYTLPEISASLAAAYNQN